MEQVISDGVCIIAVDPNNDDFVVGIRSSFVVDKETAEKDSILTLEEAEATFPQPHANIMYLLAREMPESVVFNAYPVCKRIFDMFAMGTHPSYQRRGIAGKLINHSWNVARMAGCDLAMVWATSLYSAKIFRKLKMTKLRAFKWSEQKIRGETAFHNVEFDMSEGYTIKL